MWLEIRRLQFQKVFWAADSFSKKVADLAKFDASYLVLDNFWPTVKKKVLPAKLVYYKPRDSNN